MNPGTASHHRDPILPAGTSGSRNWSSAASTPEGFGGLWRHRGRPQQRLAGVGFTAVGCMAATVYERQPGSCNGRVSFIFEGIAAEEVVGDSRAILGGAAVTELDGMDLSLAVLLRPRSWSPREGTTSRSSCASRTPLHTAPRQDGRKSPLVRVDLVHLERGSGGAAFSIGPVNWFGSHWFNKDHNNAAGITENVLRHFFGDRSPS